MKNQVVIMSLLEMRNTILISCKYYTDAMSQRGVYGELRRNRRRWRGEDDGNTVRLLLLEVDKRLHETATVTQNLWEVRAFAIGEH